MNPSTFRVGYYIGWAYGFPFKAIGPPDHDGQPFAALWAFGFDDGPELLPAVVGPMRGEPSAGRRIGRCRQRGGRPAPTGSRGSIGLASVRIGAPQWGQRDGHG
jgi:hypothetical protein